MRRPFVITLCIVSLCLAALPRPAFAQMQSSASLDVVLALDNSGSMKKNDPKRLMRQAVSEFAGQLPPDSRIGIVLFDQNARLVLDLVPAGDPGLGSSLAESLKGLNYRGRLTDIPAGVERAIYALRQSGRENARRAIVLFTDGIVETGSPGGDLERSRWLRESLAPDAKRLGIRIFGIAFTEAADFQLMQSLAETTEGGYFRALAATDLAGAFSQIAARMQELPSAPAAASPALPTPLAPQAASGSPYYVFGALIVAIVVILAVVIARRTRPTVSREIPSIAAHLRDIKSCTGTEIHALDKSMVRIGREENVNDIIINQDTVSARQAVIEFRNGAFYCRDLRSGNGTKLNGTQFSDPNEIREVVLKHGDKLSFDNYEFEFVEDALLGAAQTRVVGGLAVGAGFAAGGTRLRGSPPLVDAAPLRDPQAPAPPPPTMLKPAEPESPENAGGPSTRLKPDMCPNHPAWKATELCPVCQIPKCKSCMTQKDGKPICSKCATDAETAGKPA